MRTDSLTTLILAAALSVVLTISYAGSGTVEWSAVTCFRANRLTVKKILSRFIDRLVNYIEITFQNKIMTTIEPTTLEWSVLHQQSTHQQSHQYQYSY